MRVRPRAAVRPSQRQSQPPQGWGFNQHRSVNDLCAGGKPDEHQPFRVSEVELIHSCIAVLGSAAQEDPSTQHSLAVARFRLKERLPSDNLQGTRRRQAQRRRVREPLASFRFRRVLRTQLSGARLARPPCPLPADSGE